MRNYLLLLIAIIVRFIIEPILLIRGIYLWGDNFAFNIAKDLDREGETLFWNTEGTHTISAVVYKREKWWAVKTIDWLFQEPNHCKIQYEIEFKNKDV